MPKPAELPTWATTLANRLKPVSGAFLTGFLPGQRPPPRWANWLWGMLCDWVGWFEEFTVDLDERLDEARHGLRTGYGSYTVDTGTYASGDYYPLTTEFQSYGGTDLRAGVLRIETLAGAADCIGITSNASAYGLWAIFLDLEFSTATDGTSSAVELISHPGTPDPSSGTVVATFHSNVSGDPGGYTSIRGTYMFYVTATPTPNFSLRVNAGSDQEFNVAGRRKSVYIAQLSRSISA